MSLFSSIPIRPADPILGLKTMYTKDPSPNKVDLGVGVFKLPSGDTYIPPAVQTAKEKLMRDGQSHNYLGSSGNKNFARLTGELIYGDLWDERKITIVQSLSGTGGLRVGAEFLSQFFTGRKVFMSTPTWGNHFGVFEAAGMETGKYRYYDPKTIDLDILGMLEDIRGAPRGSVFVFHACAHNPTGVDPTKEQWGMIAEAVKENEIIPFFDAAYIGFATGSVDDDAYSIRLFASLEIEFVLSQSFAKNFGLYGERIGSFSIFSNSPTVQESLVTQIERIVRVMYSNPPRYGASIVEVVLSNPELRQGWFDSLTYIGEKIRKARQSLYDALVARETPGDWSHILRQIGMFSYTGLSESAVKSLIDDHHIYLLSSGRINIMGVTEEVVDYVADAIDAVVRAEIAKL